MTDQPTVPTTPAGDAPTPVADPAVQTPAGDMPTEPAGEQQPAESVTTPAADPTATPAA